MTAYMSGELELTSGTLGVGSPQVHSGTSTQED